MLKKEKEKSMAVSFCQIFHLPSSPSVRSARSRIPAASSSSSPRPSSQIMDQLRSESRNKFLEFPMAATPVRELMVDLVSSVESRLETQLLPCSLPLDVQHCLNDSGTARASLYARSGLPSSPVDLMLGSWLHCKLPTGAALNITSLSAYLNPSTDAPNFVIELIQSSPTLLVFILDLIPRKDLILHPDYLQVFYEETQLDTQREALYKLPEVHPYFSSSLYLRCLISPTAIMVRVEVGTDGVPGRMEEIMKDHIGPVAKQVLGIWLDNCAGKKREVGEEEKGCLMERDKLIKSKSIEIDLGTNFPRLFGPELTERVVGTIRKLYNV